MDNSKSTMFLLLDILLEGNLIDYDLIYCLFKLN